MAEKGASSIATQKIEDQLTCPVCLDQFTDPRTLPCLHSFCVQCLKGLPLNQKGNDRYSLSCPTCRTEADLNQQGVAGLPKAFNLNNLKEVHDLMKKVSDEKKIICDNCNKEGATGYCPECVKFICPSCAEIHKQWSTLAKHEIMSINEVSSKTSQMIPLKPEPVMNCSSHSKPLDLYCVTCEQPICYHCTIKSHKGHSHDLMTDAFEQSKEDLRHNLQQVEERIVETNQKRVELQQRQKILQEDCEKRKTAINELCDKLVESVGKARALGMHFIDSGLKNMMSFEDEQIKSALEHVEELHRYKDHTEHNLKLATPTQLLMAKKQMITRMEVLMKSDQFDPTIDAFHIDTNQECSREIAAAFSALQTNLIIPFCYPKKVYMQCEIIPDFPKVINIMVKPAAILTFMVLYQGRPILIDKRDISCIFYSHIKCVGEVNYLINGEEVKYQVKFYRNPGIYTLELKIGGLKLYANQINVKAH